MSTLNPTREETSNILESAYVRENSPTNFDMSNEPAPTPYPRADELSREPIDVYMRNITRTPLLDKEEEVELSRRSMTGDEQARERLIRSNLRLVVKIAYEYKDFGVNIMDLVCEGNVALIRAIERYDPDKGAKLSSYAAWWIRHAMKRFIATHSKTIRLPIHQIDRLSKIRHVTNQLRDLLDREPTDQEIATELNIPVHKVAHLKTVSTQPSSLHAPLKEDGDSSLLELVGDAQSESPSDIAENKSLVAELNLLLDYLHPREAEILRKRFGLDQGAPQTLEEVSQDLNITRERVRQIQNKALRKMREALKDYERQRTKEEVKVFNLERERMRVLQEFIENKECKAS